LYLKEGKKIQLQEMVAKPNVMRRAEISQAVEKVVPPELRKVIDDIEREISKLYAVYEDQLIKKPNESHSQGSIRIQNLDID